MTKSEGLYQLYLSTLAKVASGAELSEGYFRNGQAFITGDQMRAIVLGSLGAKHSVEPMTPEQFDQKMSHLGWEDSE